MFLLNLKKDSLASLIESREEVHVRKGSRGTRPCVAMPRMRKKMFGNGGGFGFKVTAVIPSDRQFSSNFDFSV